MDENFVGYLLDALDADERRKVETYLRAHPEARKRVQRLRQALDPLAADLQPAEPPPGLWVRTLARVAEHQCRELPPAPVLPLTRTASAGRGWWRRADVAVAASILFCLVLLIPSAVSSLRHKHAVAACQNNLREFYVGLKSYSDQHGGELPNVAVVVPPPRNVAGMVVPVLHASGTLSPAVQVGCPARGRQAPTRLTPDDVQSMAEEDFKRCAPDLAGSYGYSLGYVADGVSHGLRLAPGQPNVAFQPVMADCPPANVADGAPGFSPNHAGRGQNVLYLDGHCAFKTNRHVGVGGDDIYLNHHRKVAAGLHPWDAVIAGSAARP